MPVFTACLIQNSFITGNMPGNAASTKLTWVFGSAPNFVDELEKSFDSDNTSWSSRFSGFIKLPADISWQLFGYFRGPSETAHSRSKAFGTVTSAFQKTILKKKGTISFKVNDAEVCFINMCNNPIEIFFISGRF